VFAAARGRLFQSIPEATLLRVTSAEIEVDRLSSFLGDGEILMRGQRRFALSIGASVQFPSGSGSWGQPIAEPRRAA
jgi:hypothetical protein